MNNKISIWSVEGTETWKEIPHQAAYNSTFLKDLTRDIQWKVIWVNDTLHKAQISWELAKHSGQHQIYLVVKFYKNNEEWVLSIEHTNSPSKSSDMNTRLT